MRESLEAKARRLAGRHPNLTVTFTDWLSARERDSVLRGADLLTVPSRWPEPFGLTGVEAASLGVPAVAFDVGGIADWLRHGETGILVPPSFPKVRRFADAIVKCLGDLPALERMGERARAHAAAFTVDGHLERLEPLLAEVAATRSSFPAVPA
jgi:glycosyltransferase involved in cell wall biosynthesis